MIVLPGLLGRFRFGVCLGSLVLWGVGIIYIVGWVSGFNCRFG